MEDLILCSSCECPDVQVQIKDILDDDGNPVWANINTTSVCESDVYWCPECGHVSEITDPEDEDEWSEIGGLNG